jgi:branched-subunit amino acid aminotransferase/4-amino-4-deoxychorismate lyase
LVKKEATSRGFYDALILNERGFITETSSANFYCLKDGTLLTPPLEDGLLPGITRRVLLETDKAIEVQLEPDFLKKCEKFYISNSLLGLKEINIDGFKRK